MSTRNLLSWLRVRRGQRAGAERVTTAAERANQAADAEAITAALQARTLRRGRVRVDDAPTAMVRRSAPPRGTD